MGLKKDLETIRAASQKILDDCNAVAKLAPADNLSDVPRLIIEAEQVGYTEGDAVGYEIGYNAGEGSAEAAVLQDCNPLLEKYITPAETVDELPAKIEEVHSVGVEDGISSVVDPDKIIEATASGTDMVVIDDVSEVNHDVTVEVSGGAATKVQVRGKNLLDCGTVEFTQMATLFNSTEDPIPAGTYTFSADIRSTDTDSSKCLFTYWWSTAAGQYSGIGLTRGGRQSVTFTTTLPIVRLMAYAGEGHGASAGDTAVFTDCQLELGTTATPYEPYKVPVEYELGETVKSICPTMIVTTDAEGVNIDVRYRKSWGKQAGGNELLAAYQENGNRTNYNTGFAGIGWTQELHDQLPYPITVEFGWYCFGYSKVKYLTHVSFAQHKGLATMACCYGCDLLEEVGDFDLYYSSDVRNFFYNCKELKKVNRFVFPSTEYLTVGFHTNIFYNCEALEEINVDGVAGGYDISFKQSKVLNKSSLVSIVTALDDTGGYTLTLSQTAVNAAFETAEGANDGSTSTEWVALKSTKPNWTFKEE